MCYGCYEEAGSPAIINDKTKAAAALVAEVYEYSLVGGNAHIVVDDWNLEDDNIRWCLDTALAENVHEADDEQLAAERACLEALLALTPAEHYETATELAEAANAVFRLPDGGLDDESHWVWDEAAEAIDDR